MNYLKTFYEIIQVYIFNFLVFTYFKTNSRYIFIFSQFFGSQLFIKYIKFLHILQISFEPPNHRLNPTSCRTSGNNTISWIVVTGSATIRY